VGGPWSACAVHPRDALDAFAPSARRAPLSVGVRLLLIDSRIRIVESERRGGRSGKPSSNDDAVAFPVAAAERMEESVRRFIGPLASVRVEQRAIVGAHLTSSWAQLSHSPPILGAPESELAAVLSRNTWSTQPFSQSTGPLEKVFHAAVIVSTSDQRGAALRALDSKGGAHDSLSLSGWGAVALLTVADGESEERSAPLAAPGGGFLWVTERQLQPALTALAGHVADSVLGVPPRAPEQIATEWALDLEATAAEEILSVIDEAPYPTADVCTLLQSAASQLSAGPAADPWQRLAAARRAAHTAMEGSRDQRALPAPQIPLEHLAAVFLPMLAPLLGPAASGVSELVRVALGATWRVRKHKGD
jgi:hypothetical protein